MDCAAYFARIGHAGDTAPTLATLTALHEAHAAAIPFENVDVLASRTPSLDPAELEDKLVRRRRGGYCYEQNLLLMMALRALGFTVRPLLARVRFRRPPGAVMPRTHLLLLVEIEGRPFIADVGFGGLGLLEPLPLEADRVFAFPLVSFRLLREGDAWVLQGDDGGGWGDLHAFTLDRQELADIEMSNFYTATHPGSPFRRALTAQRVRRDERTILRDNTLIRLRSDGRTEHPIATEDEARAALAEHFGLILPHDLRLPERLFAVGAAEDINRVVLDNNRRSPSSA